MMAGLIKRRHCFFEASSKMKAKTKESQSVYELCVWSDKRECQLSAHLCTISSGGAMRTFVMKLRRK